MVESLYGQDLDSGHHGSGFPLPPFRQRLLEAHLAQAPAPTPPFMRTACLQAKPLLHCCMLLGSIPM